jgi:hypothetical protein
MKYLLDLCLVIGWIAGVYVIQSIPLKMLAFIFPPYAWYEFVGAIITKYNLL